MPSQSLSGQRGRQDGAHGQGALGHPSHPGTPQSPSQHLSYVSIRQLKQCQVPVPMVLGRTWLLAPHHWLVQPRAPAKGSSVAQGTSTVFGSRSSGPGPSPRALSSPHLTCSPVNTNPFSFSLFLCSLLVLQESTARAATEKKNAGHHY